jgi:hypothetical protein
MVTFQGTEGWYTSPARHLGRAAIAADSVIGPDEFTPRARAINEISDAVKTWADDRPIDVSA